MGGGILCGGFGTEPDLFFQGEVVEIVLVGEEFGVVEVDANFFDEVLDVSGVMEGVAGIGFIGGCFVGRWALLGGATRFPRVIEGRVEFFGAVFEGLERLGEAAAGSADVSGKDGGQVGGRVGAAGFRGRAEAWGESPLEAEAKGVVDDEIAQAMDQEEGFGDLAFGHVLLEGVDEIGGDLALFGVHPVFALGEVGDIHSRVS